MEEDGSGLLVAAPERRAMSRALYAAYAGLRSDKVLLEKLAVNLAIGSSELRIVVGPLDMQRSTGASVQPDSI